MINENSETKDKSEKKKVYEKNINSKEKIGCYLSTLL